MKQGLTDITFVVDRSASMRDIAHETEQGIANILEEQRKLPGECLISLVLFDDQIERPYIGVPISEVGRVKCEPRGNTALLDAIATGITTTGDRLKKATEADRPEHVLVVITTDGEENSSQHHSMADVAKMIAHQRDVYKWEFMFLGANQDAIANAAKINIAPQAAMAYAANAGGTKGVYTAINRAVTSNRVSGHPISFNADDRAAAMDVDPVTGGTGGNN